MLILRDYTKINIPNRFLRVNDQGTILGEFDIQPWLSDNATALEDGAHGVGMKINVLASMSGVLINRRVYPGEEWKKAAPFFAERPFLMYHNTYGDAVGRIEKGNFEQKRTGRAFENDWKRPKIQELGKSPRPSGIVTVDGMITDPSIIEQIQDTRVLHVSQGSRAGVGDCSICSNNWADGKWCEHTPGRWYDKETGDKVSAGAENSELAYTIIRDLIPIEVSFVADPALREARILEFDQPMDEATADRWDSIASELNTTDTIMEQDTVNELVLVDRNGDITTLKLVNDEHITINTPATQPEATETTDVDVMPNHQQNDSADTKPVPAKSSDNGVHKMDWEKKFADRTEEMLETRADLKESQIDAERAKAKLETREVEAASLKSDLEARDAKIAELEEDVKDGAGANKKLLEEVRIVYIDRYESALKVSRPDLSDKEVTEACEALTETNLEAVKLLVAEREKFAKAPLVTTPSKTGGDAGTANDSAAVATAADSENKGDPEEIEEEHDSLDL